MNNCRQRDHRTIYANDDAFYDLATIGPQAEQATNIRAGDTCVVATLADEVGQITFTSFLFVREDIRRDTTGTLQRVLFGTKMESDTISKTGASQGIYSAFFNKSGQFKRQSVIQR